MTNDQKIYPTQDEVLAFLHTEAGKKCAKDFHQSTDMTGVEFIDYVYENWLVLQ